MSMQQVIAVVLAIVVGGLGLAIVFLVAFRKIKLDDIFQEEIDKGVMVTSLSKFQFLIFTFVIGLSLFLITVEKKDFPSRIDPSVLALLGISAGTAIVSNGITSAKRTRLADIEKDKDIRLADIEKDKAVRLAEINKAP
jgi:uncharacterized membrane protein